MIDLLVAFDEFLLDRVFQRIADWVQHRWGWSCFWLSRQCLTGSLACYALFVVLGVSDLLRDPAAGDFGRAALVIIALLAFAVLVPWWHRGLERAEQRVLREGMNRERLTGRLTRLYMVFMVAVMDTMFFTLDPVEDEVVAMTGFLTLLLACSYFQSCTPPPPKPKPRAVPAAYPAGA